MGIDMLLLQRSPSTRSKNLFSRRSVPSFVSSPTVPANTRDLSRMTTSSTEQTGDTCRPHLEAQAVDRCGRTERRRDGVELDRRVHHLRLGLRFRTTAIAIMAATTTMAMPVVCAEPSSHRSTATIPKIIRTRIVETALLERELSVCGVSAFATALPFELKNPRAGWRLVPVADMRQPAPALIL